jgi:hypothetical protein
MATDESRTLGDGDDLPSQWSDVPQAFQYLYPWASKFGLRGLTVYFGERPPLRKFASEAELIELSAAYETIARSGDVPAITAWCLSIPPEASANEAKEQIRGLLLLFERLADAYGLRPFTDGRVRYITPDLPPFDWSVLPPHLRHCEPWLRRFEGLRTEEDVFQYTQCASGEQLRELAALKQFLDGDGQPLLEWCEANNVKGNPAMREAFQGEWLFLLVDFAKSRIEDLP